MAKSKKILVKESEEELLKLKIKQPAHLKKRIQMLLILKKSEVSLSKNELSALLKINHNTAQSWRNLYFKNGIDGLLSYGRIGFKPSIISPELHKALEIRLNSPKDAFTSYVDLIQWITENYIPNGINYQTINSYVKRHFKAKLKVARKSHVKKDPQAVESFKKTSSKS
jgi:transposase